MHLPSPADAPSQVHADPLPPLSRRARPLPWLWPALLVGSIAGALLQLTQPALWSPRIYAALLIAGVALVVGARYLGAAPPVGAMHPSRAPHGVLRWLAFVAAALASFAVCGLRAEAFVADALDPALEGRDLRITGVVVAMPQSTDAGLRLRLAVESARREGGGARGQGRRGDAPAAPPDGGGVEQPTARVPPLIDVAWYAATAPWFAQGGQGEPTAAAASAEARTAWLGDAAAAPLPAVRAGERWSFTVRLKAPHGLRNPGGFDAELWLWEQGVQATGYVRAGARDAPPALLQAAPWWRHPVEQARQRVRDAILARLAPEGVAGRGDPEGAARLRTAGVVAALVTGDQRMIDRADWDVFRATGVAHLVSISGLHITLFAWVAAGAVGWLWRRSPRLCLAVPAPSAALAGGVLLAAAYALFSGWGVPAQRTVGMLAVVGLLRLSGRRWPWPQVWLLACAAVVAADPWALLQAGFWLSFVAVAVLFASNSIANYSMESAASGLFGLKSRAWALLREQWVVTLALTPLTLLLFGQVSVVGLAANLVAIPWMTLVVTPLALLGVLWAPLWTAAAACLAPFAALLQWMAGWEWATLALPAAPLWAGVAGVAGGTLLVARLPWGLRLQGLPLLLPVLWWQPVRPAPGQFELLAPDVGQGQAVLVRTAGHALLYDAGPRYGPDSDAGDRVLVPLLRARGERLDRLVLSHRDSDHTGGAQAVLAAHPGAQLWGSLEPGHPLEAQGARAITRCAAGQRWTWDGVRFEVLHPPPGAFDPATRAPAGAAPAGPRAVKPNTLSCVLRVTAAPVADGRHAAGQEGGADGRGDGDGPSALLVGDIERAQEAVLAAGGMAPADVLLVPHHGSKTSSSDAFLDAIRPRTAVVQAGYRNRFGHPAPEVVGRYAVRGAQVVDSASCGAMQWQSARPLHWRCEREAARRYWHHAPPPAAETR
ncbi:DNA internalization-related competence protein ComEC/Rec2 [Acidovorax sp. NCPPB 4044]|uniref:DNA internalization-related competence protein ComEC/Rec2 n=1 Tax=Acidovorax sp. NCPPB 4044 TaxID=2940490 RepID=UPI00230349F7|nr:DNA internalization-related competence protein ComEC/Rec2 [Acidovorax sp. NCPPB 4044]MDA8519869.1 DNA internalization-related competence protein ComEC/Rec2 [Acidovorax sp. NCPPB 4044]